MWILTLCLLPFCCLAAAVLYFEYKRKRTPLPVVKEESPPPETDEALKEVEEYNKEQAEFLNSATLSMQRWHEVEKEAKK